MANSRAKKAVKNKKSVVANSILASGGNLGGLIFKSSTGIQLSCMRNKRRVRGLFAKQDIPKGSEICRLVGKRIMSKKEPDIKDTYCFFISKGIYLQLDPPTIDYPGNLINTSLQTGFMDKPNNCYYEIAADTDYVKVIASVDISNGEELLTSYGPKFDKEVAREHKQKIEENKKAFQMVTCGVCNVYMRYFLLKKHKCKKVILSSK